MVAAGRDVVAQRGNKRGDTGHRESLDRSIDVKWTDSTDKIRTDSRIWSDGY